MHIGQTKRRLGYIISVSAGVVITLGFLGLLVGTSQMYSNYERLSSAYSDLSIATEAQYNHLVDLLEASSASEVPAKPAIIEIPPNTFVLIGPLLSILIWLVGVSSLVIVLRIHRVQIREMETEIRVAEAESERRVENARKLGRAEGLRQVVQGLVEDKDVLADVVEWLQDYRQGKATIDDAARVHGRILERLVKQAHLTPIGQLGQTVRFDPRVHATYDLLDPGATGEIVELGWKVSREVVKKPIVREVKV